MEEVLFRLFPSLDLSCGLSPGGTRNRKFMDYGFYEGHDAAPPFRQRISGTAEAVLTNYYGGQFYAVFLTKITFTDVKQTYHLMRTMVASFAFVLPFSITYHLAESRACHRIRKDGSKSQIAPVLGGLSEAPFHLAGNMHYDLRLHPPVAGTERIGLLVPEFDLAISGGDPLVENDRTIHEFPSYSFVLGDLHAHGECHVRPAGAGPFYIPT